MAAVPRVRAASVDAIYRETHTLIEGFARAECQIVNMETAALYAAAETCGVEAVWIGHISDCLVHRCWQPWHSLEEMTAASGALALDVLAAVVDRSAAVSGGT